MRWWQLGLSDDSISTSWYKLVQVNCQCLPSRDSGEAASSESICMYASQ